MKLLENVTGWDLYILPKDKTSDIAEQKKKHFCFQWHVNF